MEIHEAMVDCELESLLGMFNFDHSSSEQQKQDDNILLSSFYNEINGFSSDHTNFPFGSMFMNTNYQSLLDSSDHQKPELSRSQEMMKPNKKQRLSLEMSLNSSDDEKGLGLGFDDTLRSVKGKGRRASKGTATDPQSLYARKRREKINERLKTLQNLVPNGTKVDISTMLEDAVHYVKFLQLQIKLLSSDELWKYAALANNGVDVGLHQNLLSRFI